MEPVGSCRVRPYINTLIVKNEEKVIEDGH